MSIHVACFGVYVVMTAATTASVSALKGPLQAVSSSSQALALESHAMPLWQYECAWLFRQSWPTILLAMHYTRKGNVHVEVHTTRHLATIRTLSSTLRPAVLLHS